MAKYSKGINGPFSGKVGAVVGAKWRGIEYMRSRPARRTDEPGEKEQRGRDRFGMAHYWLQPLLGFVRQGFKNDTEKSFGFNAAKSYVLKNAFEGAEPDIAINPALVKLSDGKLPLSTDITAEKSGDNAITFTWDIKIPDAASPFDQVMLAAYNVEERKAYQITTGQFRYTGAHTLPVGSGRSYHLYLAFTAADRKSQSDSVYLGKLEM